MRKQIKLKLEIGDVNYVKPGEYFGILDDAGKLVSLQVRQDDLTMKTLVETPTTLESNKAVSINVSEYSAPVEITSSTKDGMAKVTVTLTNIPEPAEG